MAFRGPASTPIDLMRGTTRSRDTVGTRVSRCGYPQVFPRQSWQSPRQSRQPDSKLSEWCRPPGAKVSTARPGSPWSTSWEYWVSKAPFVATPLTSLDSKAFGTPCVAALLTSLDSKAFEAPFVATPLTSLHAVKCIAVFLNLSDLKSLIPCVLFSTVLYNMMICIYQ